MDCDVKRGGGTGGEEDTAETPTRINSESCSSPSEEFHSLDDFDGHPLKTEIPETERSQYQPVVHHWFYRLDKDGKSIWKPFSRTDSTALEQAHNSPEMDDVVVATDGGRYDVNLLDRKRFPVYWTGAPTSVRRCSWFYKGTTDARYVPYAETIADILEEEYRKGTSSGVWHRRIPLPSGESVVLHGPTVMVHFQQPTSPDTWGNTPFHQLGHKFFSHYSDYVGQVIADGPLATRPRVVRRGSSNSEIEAGEPRRVDHLLLFVHGIGSVCDLKSRTIEEVVDEFRSISLQLIQSHYKSSCEKGLASRIEVLPVAWHSKLHSEETGIDRQMNMITLDSISKLRNFTNDTVLDVLFYTSPVFCQTIVHSVASELNRLYDLFVKRNPGYEGGVSMAGHSLGSLIMFDLLYHQKPTRTEEKQDEIEKTATPSPPEPNKPGKPTNVQCSSLDHKQLSKSANVNQTSTAQSDHKQVSRTPSSYVVGAAGTGQPFITYPKIEFHPKALFALGSPIGIFECVRGIDALGEDFALPTCPAFFNIFHPHDPVAYRIEPLINPELTNVRPELIPHHKGRKRMHLELKDTMTRVGAELKARLLESVNSTWAHLWRGAQAPPPPQQLEKGMNPMTHSKEKSLATSCSVRNQNDIRQVPGTLVDFDNRVVEEQLGSVKEEDFELSPSTLETIQLNSKPGQSSDAGPLRLGRLNAGRRVDYVLQEAPIEMFNEYLSAVTSHCCYWDSEDTVLLMLREIYGSIDVEPDSRVPQHSLTVEVDRTVADGRDENTTCHFPSKSTEQTNKDTVQFKTP